jgi:tRNA (cmo5U34)-methyltransferase
MKKPPRNEYTEPERVHNYLSRADAMPHRSEGEAVVMELLPADVRRILDLGTGDGRLLAMAKRMRPHSLGVALDFSPVMLDLARGRFAEDGTVKVVGHDLNLPLPPLGKFDVVLSGLAIHHLPDERKIALYGEVFGILEPEGVFCNFEHVSSPCEELHAEFFRALGRDVADEDPSNQCAGVETQLDWLRRIGFLKVDCYWKWREFALLAGVKPHQAEPRA